MRRTLASAACALVVVAAVAFGQGRLTTDSGGIIGGNPPQPGGAIGATPPSRFTVNYTFEGNPKVESDPRNVSGAGWNKTASSNLSEVTGAAPLIITSKTPLAVVEMQAGGAYMRLSEAGFDTGPAALPVISQTRAGEYKVLFKLFENATAPLGGDDEVFQICVGDTAFVKFSKKPVGFGIVYFGSDSAGAGNPGGGFVSKPADWPTDTFIGYVSSGTDTTYKPLLAYPQNKTLAHNLTFLIYAAPNNGPVSFYINGALKATIADVTRAATQDQLGLSVICSGGDTNQPEVRFGPLSIERDY